MPIHDWASVEAGIFHDFHHALIEQIKRDLNAGILPRDYYAMAEQVTAGLIPDVLTLQSQGFRPDQDAGDDRGRSAGSGAGGALLAPPEMRTVSEVERDFYRRKQSRITVRHVTDDRVVAVIEVISPGNKSTRQALDRFVEKVGEFLDQGIHLLIVDLHPPGRYDPQGIHGAIWEYIAGKDYLAPPDKPLTLAAYEADRVVRAHVEPIAVGDALPDMPLFLKPGGCVMVPLERSYQTTWDTIPAPLKYVIEGDR